MKSMKLVRNLMLTMLFCGAVAWAQPKGPGPGPDDGPTRERIRERIKTMKVWKLTEEVGLTPEQSEKFFPIYNRYQKNVDDLEFRRVQMIDRLERLANDSAASDKEIAELSGTLENFPKQILEERDRLFRDVSSILTERQQAKLIVFEERFKQRLQQFVREIRRDFRGGGMDNR